MKIELTSEQIEQVVGEELLSLYEHFCATEMSDNALSAEVEYATHILDALEVVLRYYGVFEDEDF